jgi:hypothetical protein
VTLLAQTTVAQGSDDRGLSRWAGLKGEVVGVLSCLLLASTHAPSAVSMKNV